MLRCTTAAIAAIWLLIGASAAWATSVRSDETADILAVAAAFNEGREVCYASPECPNIDQLMALFTSEPRRTEIQRNNNVVLLEGSDAIRADHLRVASSFTGRKLETTSASVQGRNAVILQLNWDPGAAEPNPFTSVLRVEDGKIAHWILVAP